MTSRSAQPAPLMLGMFKVQDPPDANVDIVAIHGLGANPEKSWEYEHEDGKSFNWLKDENGLKGDFPRARVLQFAYGSAYLGRFKMKQYMVNLAAELLGALQLEREDCSRRPLVLLGHSMGGIVIAKALCLADHDRQTYPDMYESISGCLFFGTPFNGAPVADVAAYWAKINEQFGKSINSSLLALLTPGNETLRELKRDFIRSAGKLSQKVELHCFYEEKLTEWDNIIAKLTGQNFPKELLEKLSQKESREFVSRDSASLDDSKETGLHKAHRDLVRFESFKDPQYQRVRAPLKQIVQNGPRIAKARFNCTRQTVIDRRTLDDVLKKLDGPDVSRKYNSLLRRLSSKSWIVDEPEYKQWLSPKNSKDDSHIWICGSEGKGKTAAATATIQDIQSKIEANDDDSANRPDLLAYFFCDQVQDFSTAEDVLKSLLSQLCQQQEVLATYAKMFLSKKASETHQSAHMSIEHLWQCLRDMLTEGSIGTIYFVINNLHDLQETDPSTKKLLSLIQKDIQHEFQEKAKRVTTRWFLTSRDRKTIRECMQASPSVQSIDLESEKYGKNLKLELKQHAWAQIDGLQKQKKYNKAITYFAGSVIGNRAEDTKWIDVAVVRLAGLPPGSNDVLIRRMLERVPQDFRALLDEAWASILKPNTDDIESIKELLRALILTYQDPTESELLVLIGSSPDNKPDREHLRRMIEKCKPLLTLPKAGENGKISFVNADVKRHLHGNSEKLLGLQEDDIKLQHGILAMRCFSHVVDCHSSPEEESKEIDTESVPIPTKGVVQHPQFEKEGTSAIAEGQTNHNSDNMVSAESDETDDEAILDVEEQLSLASLPYATIYWLEHASQATLDVAQRLCFEGEAFWEPKSPIMMKWIQEYEALTNLYELQDVSIYNLTALHVAATVGFPHLVESLFQTGHEAEIHEYDSLVNQPLHLAAAFGKTEIVEQLLSKGAAVDAAGSDGTNCTPLAMAALSGNTETMSKLILWGANKDAVASSIGPVINGAIISGITEAVTMLIQMGVKLSGQHGTDEEEDHDQQESGDSKEPSWEPPLPLAAMISDISMFSTILEAGSESLTHMDLAKALFYASGSGRIEIVEKLLNYEHEPHNFQASLDSATEERNWDVVCLLLRRCEGLDCDAAFKSAATGSENLLEVLEECWRHTGESIPQELLDSCLYTATDFEKEETVIKLLEFGADPNAPGEEYGNALTAACHDGTIKIVEALLGKGADVNAPDGYALQAAAAQGHLHVVKLLLEHDAWIDNLSEKHDAGRALQAACNNSHIEIVKLLLDNGANANLGGGSFDRPIFAAIFQANREMLCRLLEFEGLELDISGGPIGSTPIHYASIYLTVDDVKLLIEANVPVDITDSDGDTALMGAALTGDHETVHLLLEHNADFMIANNFGVTPLDVAAQLGHAECVRLLAARASKVLSLLKEAAANDAESALEVLKAEMESRSESMAKEPSKIFENPQELVEFHRGLGESISTNF